MARNEASFSPQAEQIAACASTSRACPASSSPSISAWSRTSNSAQFIALYLKQWPNQASLWMPRRYSTPNAAWRERAQVVLRQQDSATIRRLVAELPAPFREAIVLREINDLSYQEIAEVTGVPVGTVMSRLARARAMLRSAWNTAEASTAKPGSATASGITL